MKAASMNTVPFFSIIMPVYGVERYLPEAVHSILSQSYGEFELILVDDCSPDRCPQMCDEFAKEDSRITVIHKPQNQGLGEARNTGMEHATGEYVMFVDSDDSLVSDTLHILKDALDTSADIIAFGMKRVYENKDGVMVRSETFTCTPCESHVAAENGEIFLKLTDAHLFPYVCNKAYRRTFLQSQAVVFEQTKLIEDFLFNIALFEAAEHIRVVEDCLYAYRKPAHRTLVNSYAPEFYELTKRKYCLERAFLEKVGETDSSAIQTVLYSHIKHIFSVFLRNHTPESRLSCKEQLATMRMILSDDVTRDVLREFRPHGVAQTGLSMLLRSRLPFVCYGAVLFVNLIQER